MATLVFVLVLLVAVALIVVSLRALVVAFEALRLTHRLKLTARALPERVRRPNVSDPLALSHSSYPPIRVLYPAKR
ncbi:MAG TPA: hypothetical protein VH599_04420 [Ktedonobacterales bacterium]|jgi:hypothetical protein